MKKVLREYELPIKYIRYKEKEFIKHLEPDV